MLHFQRHICINITSIQLALACPKVGSDVWTTLHEKCPHEYRYSSYLVKLKTRELQHNYTRNLWSCVGHSTSLVDHISCVWTRPAQVLPDQNLLSLSFCVQVRTAGVSWTTYVVTKRGEKRKYSILTLGLIAVGFSGRMTQAESCMDLAWTWHGRDSRRLDLDSIALHKIQIPVFENVSPVIRVHNIPADKPLASMLSGTCQLPYLLISREDSNYQFARMVGLHF